MTTAGRFQMTMDPTSAPSNRSLGLPNAGVGNFAVARLSWRATDDEAVAVKFCDGCFFLDRHPSHHLCQNVMIDPCIALYLISAGGGPIRNPFVIECDLFRIGEVCQ